MLKKYAGKTIRVMRCPGVGLNHRHCDFQSHALPTELPRHIIRIIKLVLLSMLF